MLRKLTVLAILATPVFADTFSTPIVPENVLSQDEIDEIVSTNNYFFYKSLNETTPVWMGTHRKYGSHFFDHRDHMYSMNDVMHHALIDGFPIQQKIQELYRGRLGIHVQLGNTLPQLNFDFGQAATTHGIGNAISSVYNFLLPTNWLELINKKKAYEATKLFLAKTSLDELLNAKVEYYRQHKRIQDFEIINYYFIHLQLLTRKYPQTSVINQILQAQFGIFGTSMSDKRAEIRLGFEALALIIALAKIDKNRGTGHMNIADIQNFPEAVDDFQNLEAVYRDKETFLHAAIRNSLELKIMNLFYKISRLDIGITAFGVLETVEDTTEPSTTMRFALKGGYGTLPSVMIAQSLSKSVKIDVQKEFVDILSKARESYDFHLNAITLYTEAKRALKLSRVAFKHYLERCSIDVDLDGLFIITINHLLEAELKVNEALHLSLIARAYMDRFLLREQTDVLKFLPNKGEIMVQLEKIKGKNIEEMKREEILSTYFENLTSPKELNDILNNHSSHPLLKHLNEKELVEVIHSNMGNLLYSKAKFHKRKKFFRMLNEFVSKHKMDLTQMEAYILRKKQYNWWHRKFNKDYKNEELPLHHLNFKHFGEDHG